MLAKILFVPDLHKRDVDPSTIKGYCDVVNKIQWDIIEYIRNNGVTHFISLGDWYDKGYRSTYRAMNDLNLDREIAEAVNGNAYICLGNHRFLELAENPENFICQPSDVVNAPVRLYAKKPIFKAVNSIFIDDVQISFFHFNRENKDYIAERQLGIKTHIGIYHDDACVPSSVKQKSGFLGQTDSGYLCHVYKNIDVAIHGHLHAGIPPKKLLLSDGHEILMFVPGAMVCVQNKEVYKQPKTTVPVLIINDDSTVTYKVTEFKTYVDELQFTSSKERLAIKKFNRELLFDEGSESVQLAERDVSSVLNTTVVQYLQDKGYNEQAIQLFLSAQPGALNFERVCQILTGGEAK